MQISATKRGGPGGLIAGLLLGIGLLTNAAADVTLRGQVFDSNGLPMHHAMVTVERSPDAPGIAAVTMFTNDAGQFAFPSPFVGADISELAVAVKKLGYIQDYTRIRTAGNAGNQTAEATVILASSMNQAGTAPASAWLQSITSPEEKAKLVMNCVGCHQHPAPEVRAYAALIHNVAAADHVAVRLQSWQAMVKYMNFLSAEEFGRGNLDAVPVDARRVYSVTDDDIIPTLLAKHSIGPMDTISGYDPGARLAVTPQTVIREYRIDQPNTVREALLLGTPPRLWAADVLSNNIVRVDIDTGAQRIFTVPADIPMGPHTLLRQGNDTLWVAPFFNGIVARLDLAGENWQTWRLKTDSGGNVGIHDLSFDYRHELLTDKRGRIWYSDITNNSVGYFDPETGKSENFRVPEIPGRPGNGAALYGLVMTADQKYIWYAQLGIASFGCFNTETLEFETSVSLPMMDAGPRRITMSDEDVLYIALYGSGQLLEYDARERQMIGTYDLPDTASAPYAVTWDQVRRVVWIPTSNANVIYRFDPVNKLFRILPLPREGAFLRMVGVDPDSGLLTSAYGNIAATVHGPRMVVLIDPGDDYAALKRAAARE